MDHDVVTHGFGSIVNALFLFFCLTLSHGYCRFDEYLKYLFEAGDVELCFNDGRSIKAHATKLKLASMQGILRSLIENFVEEQIAESVKRRKMDDTGLISADTAMPQIKVDNNWTIGAGVMDAWLAHSAWL